MKRLTSYSCILALLACQAAADPVAEHAAAIVDLEILQEQYQSAASVSSNTLREYARDQGRAVGRQVACDDDEINNLADLADELAQDIHADLTTVFGILGVLSPDPYTPPSISFYRSEILGGVGEGCSSASLVRPIFMTALDAYLAIDREITRRRTLLLILLTE
jgi:hypothetical protein